MAIAPGNSFSGPERSGDFFLVEPQGSRDVPGRREEQRAVLVGQHEGLFRREFIGLAGGVVPHVSSGRLAVQPFAHVAFRAFGASCDFPCAQRTGTGHRFVEAQPVPEGDHDAAIARREIVDGPFHEFVEGFLIDRHAVLLLLKK